MPGTLEDMQYAIRGKLSENGTNLRQNDNDPQGDGDQSSLGHLSKSAQQVYRDIFGMGGDLQVIGAMGLAPLSVFAQKCLLGQVDAVKEELESFSPPPRGDINVLKQKLETRETVMRLSPLLLIVSLGKNINGGGPSLAENQERVAKLLLAYGANPAAKDVCGKTVCHYGMGAMATKMTLSVGKACIEAFEHCHLFHKTVELHGLKSADMNGKHAFCRGYVVDTGRCPVLLAGETEPVGIKPANLRLVDDQNDKFKEESGANSIVRPKLCDIPDRLGAVCLLEVIQTNRTDVARVLLNKHNANLDIADCDGVSPKSLSIQTGIVSQVAQMVNKHLAKIGRQDIKVKRNQCSYCHKDTSERDLEECGGCRQVWYCSKACQKKHWKAGHKTKCVIDQGIVLDKPQPGGEYTSTFSVAKKGFSSAPKQAAEGYVKPGSVNVNERFYVKVQGGGPAMPLLVYDKSREFEIYVQPGQPGFDEIRAKVNSEPAFQGRKTYMAASFDEQGRCTIFPSTATLKTW